MVTRRSTHRLQRGGKRKYRKKRSSRTKVQKGGGFGAGLAVATFLPQILATTGKILKINI